MELAEVVGQLAGLRRFRVRSLSGETPDECLMQGGGLVGDRIYEMVEVESGAILSAKTAPLLLRYRARYLDAMVRPGIWSRGSAFGRPTARKSRWPIAPGSTTSRGVATARSACGSGGAPTEIRLPCT